MFAENRVGLSEPSKASTATVAKDPWSIPGRPSQPRVGKMTRRSCLLTWVPPDHDGGNPIRNYVIEYRVSMRVVVPRSEMVYSRGNGQYPSVEESASLHQQSRCKC